MHKDNKTVVTRFIEEIWNQDQMQKVDQFISDGFVDHSLAPDLPADKIGMQRWIMGMGKAFHHRSEILDMVGENDRVMIRFRMHLKHIGLWRGIQPTYAEVATVGYRSYRLKAGKITEHWALLDGNSIEIQLRRSVNDQKSQG
ncbi:MAG: ester cyclase [Flavobacteriales bacterium]